MTNEEAIKELKEDRALYESDIVEAGDGTPDGDLMLAIDMAVEALEKQMPKKVITANIDGDIKLRYCPYCRIRFIKAGMKYCGECGQALDWDYRKYRLNKERDSND